MSFYLFSFISLAHFLGSLTISLPCCVMQLYNTLELFSQFVDNLSLSLFLSLSLSLSLSRPLTRFCFLRLSIHSKNSLLRFIKGENNLEWSLDHTDAFYAVKCCASNNQIILYILLQQVSLLLTLLPCTSYLRDLFYAVSLIVKRFKRQM